LNIYVLSDNLTFIFYIISLLTNLLIQGLPLATLISSDSAETQGLFISYGGPGVHDSNGNNIIESNKNFNSLIIIA